MFASGTFVNGSKRINAKSQHGAKSNQSTSVVGNAASLVGAGFWLSSQADPLWGRSANERVNIACIGVGGKGSSDTDDAAKYGQIVALCDIDDQRLENGKRNLPAQTFPGGKEPTDSGSLLIGDKGRLYSPGDSGDQQQLEVNGQLKTPEQTIERLGNEVGPDRNQKREWIRAIQGGAKPLSNFDYASVLTEAMLLGNVAVGMGKAIDYDGMKGVVTNHPDTAGLVARSPRDGWEL